MGIYGKLTRRRGSVSGSSSTYTVFEINNMYDYYIDSLVTALPDEQTSYLDSELTIHKIRDNIDLIESDPLSVQVTDVDSAFGAAVGMLRRWLRRSEKDGITISIIVIPDQSFDWVLQYVPETGFEAIYSTIGNIEDIRDQTFYGVQDDTVLQNQQDFQSYLDPRNIYDTSPMGDIMENTSVYLPRDIQNGFIMKGVATEAFDFAPAQNIYTNYFSQSSNYYNVSDISSKSIEKSNSS